MESYRLSIIMKIRLPRVLAALAGGSCLAVSGVLLQIFFNNLIVEPYTLICTMTKTLPSWTGIKIKNRDDLLLWQTSRFLDYIMEKNENSYQTLNKISPKIFYLPAGQRVCMRRVLRFLSL